MGFILSDSGPRVVITHNATRSALPGHSHVVIDLESARDEIARQPDHPPAVDLTSENLAYILYTSGSTGEPKGVMVPHRGVCNRLLQGQVQFPLTAADRVLHKAPISFDVSVTEIFSPLLVGAQVILSKPGGEGDGASLVETINRYQVTIALFPSSMLLHMLNTYDLGACQSLRRLHCGAEVVPPVLVEKVFKQLDIELINSYGPTETSIGAAFWACERDVAYSFVPIGYPLRNTRVYILDSHLTPVPVGVMGELYIAGVGVTWGYLGLPGLTGGNFLPDPFSKGPGRRMYRTGDLARYRSDGALEFKGRVDLQVKVRGYRIELEEVERVLLSHPAIAEGLVLVEGGLDNGNRLLAYLSLHPESTLYREELLAHLRKKLPDYMIPFRFFTLPNLPRLGNGKLNRRDLGDQALLAALPDARSTAPRSALEEKLVAIWQNALGIRASRNP